MSAVSWFGGGGVRASACVQGKDRTAHACAAGAGRRVGCAAVPGRFGKAWASWGTARLYLLPWAPCNRFVLTDTYPPGLRERGLHSSGGGHGSESAGGRPRGVWVWERRGEAASRRGEERRVCMAMSVSAWEVRDLQAACGGSVHGCARGRREHPAWGGDTVPGAASRARTAGLGTGGGMVAMRLGPPHAIPHVQAQRINTCASVTQNIAPQDSAGNGWWSVEMCPHPLLCKEMVKLE